MKNVQQFVGIVIWPETDFLDIYESYFINGSANHEGIVVVCGQVPKSFLDLFVKLIAQQLFTILPLFSVFFPCECKLAHAEW